MNKSHSFNTELAKLIGLKESIILSHLYFWFEQNRSNDKNFHDGTWWTYNSIKTFSKQFEYLSEKEIRGALKRLNELGYTIEGCYNKIAIDKTKWYSLTEKALKLFEATPIIQKGESFIQKGKRDGQKGKAIPDTNTDTNQINTNNPLTPFEGGTDEGIIDNSNFILEVDEFIEAYKRICAVKMKKVVPKHLIDRKAVERKLKKWVNLGGTKEEVLMCMQNIIGNNWEREHNYPSLSINKLITAETVRKYGSLRSWSDDSDLFGGN